MKYIEEEMQKRKQAIQRGKEEDASKEGEDVDTSKGGEEVGGHTIHAPCSPPPLTLSYDTETHRGGGG
jgi:hypothetical protein